MLHAFDPVPMAPGESLGAYRALDVGERARRQDAAWSAALVDDLPLSWAGRLLDRWRGRYAADRVSANLAHLKATRAIHAAQRAGVRADAGDADLCEEARQSARDMGRRIDQRAMIEAGQPPGVRLLAQWAEVWHWLESRGLEDAARRLLKLRTIGAAVLARVRDDRWWRRLLRTVQARGIEATARGLGMVHKAAACYVSEEGVRQRAAQRARNAAALEATQACNDAGQAYTLAELAAKGTANKEIRRHELMVRIAGFELIARELGHEAVFLTVTCPSRMHRMRTEGPRVAENPKWDGTAPDEAQAYLARQWARARAAAKRHGLDWYGFRIAEPNHDGTPHWHLLMFHPRETARGLEAHGELTRILRRYFLHNDSATEAGADRHRIKVERIDWAKGSAAGYVAKYVAKNVDGHRVEKDLYGNPAMASAARVEAWAARWRVRQFQQCGGPPVGVWRELRRVHPGQAGESQAVDFGLYAVNIKSTEAEATELDEQQTAAHGWAAYVKLQAGPTARRADLRVGLFKQRRDGAGRYGEALADSARGVQVIEARTVNRPAFGIIPAAQITRQVRVEVESERHQWVIAPRGFGPGRAEGPPPWSPVNNCTGPMAGTTRPAPETLLFSGIVRRPKVGRVHRFGGVQARSSGVNEHGEETRGGAVRQ